MAGFPSVPWMAPREPVPWCRTALARDTSLQGAVHGVVRQLAVPAAYSCGVRALGLNPSILPRKDLNSAKVMSLVRHSAEAGVLVSAL